MINNDDDPRAELYQSTNGVKVEEEEELEEDE